MRRDARTVGKTRDAGFQIGARRTMPLPLAEAWQLLTSRDGVKIWLGAPIDLAGDAAYQLPDGTSGTVSVFKPNSHLRMSWQPPTWPRPSIIQVRAIPNGTRTTFAFHQEHLPGPDEREARRVHYTVALDTLEHVITSTASRT
jgi:uncharacterized protein YndB with AHSA1/START domain